MGIFNFFKKETQKEKNIETKTSRPFNFYKDENINFTRNLTNPTTNYTSRVFSAVSTISSDIGQLNFSIMRGTKDIKKEYEHLFDYSFKETSGAFLKLFGNVYFEIIRNGTKITSLNPFLPSNVKIENGVYFVGKNQRRIESKDMIHIKNFSPSLSAYGYGDIQATAISIGLDDGLEVWNWNFFQNGTKPNLVGKVKGEIDKEIIDRIKEQWNNQYSGVKNAHKFVVIPDSLELQDFGIGQKEMDFVEMQKFTRDKILGIFKVPKAILGLGDGVNVGNVEAFEKIYSKRTIGPIAKLIEDEINKKIFLGIGEFKFVNIVEEDVNQTRLDFQSGILTLNEIRKIRGLGEVPNGDVNYFDLQYGNIDSSNSNNTGDQNLDNTKSIKKKGLNLNKEIENIVKNFNDEEINEKKWNKRIKRNDNYESEFKKIQEKIIKLQEEDILGNTKKIFQNTKSLNKTHIKLKKNLLNLNKYSSIYYSFFKDLYEKIYKNEGTNAMQEVGSDSSFDIGEKLRKRIENDIIFFGNGVDKTTNEELNKVYKESLTSGIGVNEIVSNLEKVFEDLGTYRLERIVRSESIRTLNSGTEEGYKESGVVEEKEWYTSKDERVCEHCGKMHKKIVSIGKNFLDKGENLIGNEGGLLKINYEDVKHAPLHSNCRCTILPVIK